MRQGSAPIATVWQLFRKYLVLNCLHPPSLSASSYGIYYGVRTM